MTIQFKPVDFPKSLNCVCGFQQEMKDVILDAHRDKSALEDNDIEDIYFSSFSCQDCHEYIWYVLLDYSDNIRIVQLLDSDTLSLSSQIIDTDTLDKQIQNSFHTLKEKYLVELEFPASITVDEYIRHHEISHIKDRISPILPLILLVPKPLSISDTSIVLIIPYYSDGKVQGEMKVNFKLSEEDREEIKELSFGLWDLLIDHYYGKINEITWDMSELVLE